MYSETQLGHLHKVVRPGAMQTASKHISTQRGTTRKHYP